jgi:hypothetical protein
MRLNRTVKPGLAVLVLVLVLSACGNARITQGNFDRIKVGMTQAEVIVILGEPTESSSLDIAGFSGTNSTWKGREITIAIQFLNGKVVAKQFSKPG